MREGGGTKLLFLLLWFCKFYLFFCLPLAFWSLAEPLGLSSPEGVRISHPCVPWLDTVSVTGQGLWLSFPSWTMDLSVFGPPSSPPGPTIIVTLSSAQCILVWGEGSCHLCPLWSKQSGRGGVGRQDRGLVLASPVLEACSDN